jgi:hypothetical protein
LARNVITRVTRDPAETERRTFDSPPAKFRRK